MFFKGLYDGKAPFSKEKGAFAQALAEAVMACTLSPR